MEEWGKGVFSLLALILYSFLAGWKKKKAKPPVPHEVKTAPKTLPKTASKTPPMIPRIKKESAAAIPSNPKSNPNPLFIPRMQQEKPPAPRIRLKSRLDRNAVILAEILRGPLLK